ncbi:MAG: hypothetical protein LBG80_03345 [Bacteroidales bacterium]|jgi:hypothetical protein|nr:hypothetical protein [Bacteroidales bacterium]
MKKRRNIVIFALIILGICFFATKERRALYSADKAYNMESYENFLSKYPESKYKERVFECMYMLVRYKAYDLLKFYQKYPNMPQASSILEEGINLACEDAKLKSTEEGWQSFLSMLDTLDKYHIELDVNIVEFEDEVDYYETTALERRKNIIETYREKGKEELIEVIFKLGEERAWELVQTEKTEDYYEKYLTYYPEGKHKKECNKLLDEMIWEIVQTERTIVRCNEYLNSFPKGKYRNKCNKLLIDLEIEEVYSSKGYGALPPMEKVNLNTPFPADRYSYVDVSNDTEYKLTLLYGGKFESKRFIFSPNQTKRIHLLNGHYRIVAFVNDPDVNKYAGEETLEGGGYDVTYYIRHGFFDYRRRY